MDPVLRIKKAGGEMGMFRDEKTFRKRLMPLAEDQAPYRESAFVLFITIAFSGFFFLFFAWGLFSNGAPRNFFWYLFLAIPAFFFIRSIILIIMRIRSWALERGEDWPDIYVDYYPVQIEKPFQIDYSRKGARSAEIRNLSVELILREKAECRSGTKRTTVFHDIPIAGSTIPPEEFRTEGELAFHRQMEIPRRSMHSFSAMNNWLIWLLRVKADIPGRPDRQYDYELRVEPSWKR